METLIPRAAAVQRRLSRLYSDTKKSSDFVNAPVQHDAGDSEIKSLHRKLQIQKQRFHAWGLEWSESPAQSAEVLIDTSLSKAGLSEIVGSVMSTIKDILAEAEPLWHGSLRLAGEQVGPDPGLPKRGEKIQLVVWDKNKFEDLLLDLTTSIDTLYGLSRTRSSYTLSSAAQRERMLKGRGCTGGVAVEEARPFQSSRMQTPQHIDPRSLTNFRDMQAVPMTELEQAERHREIVWMSKQAYADLTNKFTASTSAGRQSQAPLLLEFAPFDPIYSMTGIMPPMTRFERLSTGLQAEPQRSTGSWTGLPQLLGYFEDMEHSRLGLVYHFPRHFNPISYEHLTRNPLYNLCSLADLLGQPDFEPKLEAKFRLAANLGNTVFDMHARGIWHGNLIDVNVSFCNAVVTDLGASEEARGQVDIRRPLISSFDLFTEPSDDSNPNQLAVSLYKHPLDPRATPQSPLKAHADSKAFDLYSLSMLLLSVGLWTKAENLVVVDGTEGANFCAARMEQLMEQLATRCGTLYMKAVQACRNAIEQEVAGQFTSDQIVARAEMRASRYLEACCVLDGVTALDERLGVDLGEETDTAPAMVSASSTKAAEAQLEKGALEHHLRETSSVVAGQAGAEVLSPPLPFPDDLSAVAESKKIRMRRPNFDSHSTPETNGPDKQLAPLPSRKSRLYPHVTLPPDIVDHWNTELMPRINAALRHFYRKTPESVEISLESIGESATRTTPTVLVVCTSVSKVRAILKKKLCDLFSDATGLTLKVCRGQVLRSRKDEGQICTAQPDEEETNPAANPDYQERPQNGASIGAWIGNKHLPPVSFGGLIMVDDKTYGMTVHHMLDDPDLQQPKTQETRRSMAGPIDLHAWYAAQQSRSEPENEPDFSSSSTEGAYTCTFSDTNSQTSESAITSGESDDEDMENYFEEGDIPGIEPGCGDGYLITQPAFEDVPRGFYPAPETQDDDHLDTYTVGEIYASSGIRRRREDGTGLVHEIDWALFEFAPLRQPEGNFIPHALPLFSPGSQPTRRQSKRLSKQPSPYASQVQPPSRTCPPLTPTTVAPTTSLPGRLVQSMARTSGLQIGRISPARTTVKIYGRTSPSDTFQVHNTSPTGLALGQPGDSGAWIVDATSVSSKSSNQLCGHILAWSARKRVAYLCPMEVLLVDIAETLEAGEVRLPGGPTLIRVPANLKTAGGRGAHANQGSGLNEEGEDVEDDKEESEGNDEDKEAPGLAESRANWRISGTGSLRQSTESS